MAKDMLAVECTTFGELFKDGNMTGVEFASRLRSNLKMHPEMFEEPKPAPKKTKTVRKVRKSRSQTEDGDDDGKADDNVVPLSDSNSPTT